MATDKLTRPRSGRMLTGVCAGIAEFFDLDPTVVRVGYVLLSILSAGFPGVLVYLLLTFIVPKD